MAKVKRAPGYASSVQEFQRAAQARRAKVTLDTLTAREEWRDQKAIFDWAKEWAELCYPELHLLNGSMNGVRVESHGTRQKMAWCGLRPGWPDINLPVARGGWHGLFIELKATAYADGSRPELSSEQKATLLRLGHEGNCVLACWGSRAAIEAIQAYLDGKLKKEDHDADPQRTGIDCNDGVRDGHGADQHHDRGGDQELPGPELRSDAAGGGGQDQAETERPAG